MIADLTQQGGGEDDAAKKQRAIEEAMRHFNATEQKLKIAEGAVAEARLELSSAAAQLKKLAR